MRRAAYLSGCGRYRYTLERNWSDEGLVIGPQPEARPLLWIMLNPSTADAEKDDATIRRVVAFSRAWGYLGCVAVNLFAYRATDPTDLLVADCDVVGLDNDVVIQGAGARCAPQVMVAWGANKLPVMHQQRPREVLALLPPHAARCLGTTKTGNHPLHPLRISKDQQPVPYLPVGACTSCGAGWPGGRRDHEAECGVAYVLGKKGGGA